jgi:hypothetical protein
MTTRDFAPVLIPTLNRHEHFRRCLSSLLQNTHANKTHVYIFLDFPTKKSHLDGNNKTLEYLKTVEGFKEITVIKRTENYGAIRNIYDSIDELFTIYDEIIFSEDDNFFSPNFLEYMNKGLKVFKEKEDIFAICGYNYLIDIPKGYSSNFYTCKLSPFWGIGLWKSKYGRVELTVSSVNKFLKNYKNILNMFKIASSLFPQLVDVIKNNHITGDAVFTMNLLKSDMYCILPTLSKVRNYGNDGTGVHCTIDKENIFINQPIDDEKEFIFSDSNRTTENRELSSILSKKLKISNLRFFETFISYIVFDTKLNKPYEAIKKIFKKHLRN